MQLPQQRLRLLGAEVPRLQVPQWQQGTLCTPCQGRSQTSCHVISGCTLLDAAKRALANNLLVH